MIAQAEWLYLLTIWFLSLEVSLNSHQDVHSDIVGRCQWRDTADGQASRSAAWGNAVVIGC